MKKTRAVIIGIGFLLSVVAAAWLLAAPNTPAYAAAAEASPAAQAGIDRLENLLKREQIVLTNQQERLALSNQIVTTAQTWISKLQAQGKDVAALQSALTAFQSGLAQAQGSFNTAQNALNAHAGFDGSGKVTDKAQALQTLIAAGQAERQFHLTITQATINFRQAVQQYRQANK